MASKYKVDLANLFTNWSDDVGAWATTSGGATLTSHPVSIDNVFLDVNSGNTVIDTASACSTLDCTGYTGTLSGSSNLSVAGACTFAAGMGFTWTGGLTFNHSAGSKTYTSNGKTVASLTVAMTGTGTLNLSGTTSVSGGIVHTSRTLNLSGNNVFCLYFTSSGITSRTISLGSGTVYLTGISTTNGLGVLWDCSTATGLTVSATTGTINIPADSTQFKGGGKTYGNITVRTASGTQEITFTGTNTFTTFTSGATKLIFTDAQTAATWVLTGCTSITGNLVCASGTVTASSACTITNSAASGGATFDANGATDGGGNTGWTNFGAAAAVSPRKSSNSVYIGVGI